MKDTRTEVLGLLDEGIASDQIDNPEYECSFTDTGEFDENGEAEFIDGPHAARYRKIKALLLQEPAAAPSKGGGEPSSETVENLKQGQGLVKETELAAQPAEPEGDLNDLIEWLGSHCRPHDLRIKCKYCDVADAIDSLAKENATLRSQLAEREEEVGRLEERVEELDGTWIPLAENVPHVEEHGGDYFWVMDGFTAPTVELAWYDGEDWYNPIGEGEVYGAVTHYQKQRKPRAAQQGGQE